MTLFKHMPIVLHEHLSIINILSILILEYTKFPYCNLVVILSKGYPSFMIRFSTHYPVPSINLL